MHAGYPIMGQRSAVKELVDVEHMRKHGLWGPIHELGHNQQRACWEFPSHTTECTCNLWSVYVHEEVLGMDRGKVGDTNVAIFIVMKKSIGSKYYYILFVVFQAHPNMTLENRKNRTTSYVKNGAKLSEWHMWVALETYMQVILSNGFKKTNTFYYNVFFIIIVEQQLQMYFKGFHFSQIRNCCNLTHAAPGKVWLGCLEKGVCVLPRDEQLPQ